jgi:hypothetical protein
MYIDCFLEFSSYKIIVFVELLIILLKISEFCFINFHLSKFAGKLFLQICLFQQKELICIQFYISI